MKFIASLTFLFFSIVMSAQKPQNGKATTLAIGRLYGKILESSTKQPIAYASITVSKSKPNGQDSLISGGLTIENGDFNITALPMGAFKLKVSYVGNKDLVKMVKISPPNNIEQDLGNLTMEVDAQMLGAVEVKAEKVSTMLSLEKRVFNVDKSLSATGGTAEDVMKNLPSVTVDMDGTAKLRDRGTTIYVDGKPTLMSLTQIPASQIESVEIISNPSAKFEASTSGGILNIILKKNRKPGYNGVLALGIGNQGRYNGMLNLNVNEGKWSVGGFYNFNTSKVPTKGYVYRTNTDETGLAQSYFNQNTNVTFENLFQNGRLNIDYALDNRNTISLSGNITDGKFNIGTLQHYEYLNSAQKLSTYGERTTAPENNFNNKNVELQWKKTFPQKDKSLVALANYGWGEVSNLASWNTTGYDSDGKVLPNYPELVHIDGANQSANGIFQLDFVNPINDSTKVEMGVRSFWSARDQTYFYKAFDYTTNTYVLDNQFSQDSRITESINAAYITYSGRLKYKINYQAGLRFEQSSMKGITNLDGTSDFGYNYPKGTGKDLMRSLFPAIYFSKKIDQNSEIGLNFSRKIQRPNPRQLMPGIQANDKQNIQIGNPNLQPEFINLAELNYNKLFGSNNWLSTLYLSNETNTLKPLITPSATDPSLLVTSFVNGKNELMYGLDNTLKMAFGKNFDVMLNVNAFKFNVTVDTFSNAGYAANGKVNLTYRLPANFTIQLNSAYEGNRPIPQGNRKGIAYMDFAVKKSFFNNAANLTFSINDVFNSRKDITITTQPTYMLTSMRRRETRYFKVALQVPFGKANASMFKKGNKKPDNQQDMQDY